MKGVAVSLYDKFDDLSVLVDIIRHNWESDVFISVCSNHPQAESKIEAADIDIDEFQQGAQIRYDDELIGVRSGNNLHLRIYDNIRTACRPVIENTDVDYLMHLHADAWQITDSGFNAIIEELKRKESAVAFPSNTEMFHKHYPPGFMEDQFIVFDNTVARDVGLFDQKPLELPPMSIHLLLAMISTVRFGWDRLHQYTNGAERVHWDGFPSPGIARPMVYNPDYDQLHLATEDFDGTLGKKIQAYYLVKYEVTKGENIRKFLDEYQCPKSELFEDLEMYLNSLSGQLPIGISAETFGRDIREIREYLDANSTVSRLKILARQYRHSALYPAMEGIHEMIQRLIGSDSRDSWNKQHWNNQNPERAINDVFRNGLNEEDFPADMQNTYRESFSNN